MRIREGTKLDFDDVLLVPHRSTMESRKDVDLHREFQFYHSVRNYKGIPIFASNMSTVGTFRMTKSLAKHGMSVALHKHYPVKDIITFFKENPTMLNHAFISIGMNDQDKIKELNNELPSPNICIDIANGYTERFVEYCKEIRWLVKEKPVIMAGNVCTPEAVSELILHGEVDIVKVGIGSGMACTTRLQAGVGYPQLSCIDECANAAHGLLSAPARLGLVCADGGCKTPGDVAKAFGSSADFVMLGGMLAGTDECDGEWEYHQPQRQKKSLTFYGMSSKKAQEKHGEGLDNYKTSEGRVIKVPYKGPAKDTVQNILGGLRSACTYTGAVSLKNFSLTAEFIRVGRTHYDQSVEKL